ncbi:MAG: dihydroorotate dehydrogenase electron transfer subunit [Phycisphaerae bacterium]|nr:dihydroorotate dehydrogenase electron transfer subunit [Phycisphaerae bacterium]
MCNETLSSRGVYVATVAANDAVCDEHYRLRLRLTEFPPSRAGQFVQLQCRPPAPQLGAAVVDWPENKPPQFTQPELMGTEPLLRRPLSLAGRRDDAGAVELEILYRTVGAGTRRLANVRAGQELSVLGPLGHPLPIIDAKPAAALVGGGVGIPPMIYLAHALQEAGKKATAFCGARSRELLPLAKGVQPAATDGTPTLCTAEFAQAETPTVLTTDDGSLGVKGFITQAFEQWLDSGAAAGNQLVVYSCGPEVMMRRVGEICIARDIECYLSLERHMACGMGTCQSCVVKIRDAGEQGWSYKLCCTDGPVFPAGDVIWE